MADGISSCPSTDSLNDHFSALSERWQNMSHRNNDVRPLDNENRPASPMSPPSQAPDCVGDRAAMDATVCTTMKRVEQLSSFLSEADNGPAGGGRGGSTRFGGGRRPAASGRSMKNICCVGSDGDDSASVGSEADVSTSSTVLSDDSLQREEAALTSGHAVDEMRREMENLEKERLLLFLPYIPSISNDDDDEDNKKKEDIEKKDILCDAGTPHREIRMLNPYENGGSPSGVAEFPSCHDGNDEDVSSSSSSSSSSASPFTDLLGGESPFRSVSRSLLRKFDSTAATKRFDDDDDDASSCQLAHPDKEVPPSGWISYMAEVAYGSHEYRVTTSPPTLKPRTRTVEGGLLVTASVSVVLAILLRTSELFANYNVHVNEPQFYAALAILPPFVSLVQAKVVPHRFDETAVALGVLLGGLLLERGLC